MIPKGPVQGSILLIVFLIIFSCTIIDDGDITTQAQLSALKLTGYEIFQQTSRGNSSTQVTLLYDSAVSVTDDATGAKITRKMGFSLPPLGSLKIKLRNGTNATTELYASFKDDGQPYTFLILQGDSIIEQYRFRYNSYISTSSRVNKIVSVLNPVDGLPEKLRTNDTIIYDASFNFTSIIRRSPDASKTGTFSFTYSNSSITNITFKSSYYTKQGGNCPNGLGNSCGGYNYSTNGQYNGGAPLDYQFISSNNLLDQVVFEDHRIDSNNNGGGGGNCPGCGYDYASFYFHPLMLLKDKLTGGNDLLFIYMTDWWVPGIQNNQSNVSQVNEFVRFNYKYGL